MVPPAPAPDHKRAGLRSEACISPAANQGYVESAPANTIRWGLAFLGTVHSVPFRPTSCEFSQRSRGRFTFMRGDSVSQ